MAIPASRPTTRPCSATCGIKEGHAKPLSTDPPPSDAAKGRGVKFGRKPKLTRQQIDQARKPITAGERPEDVAETFKVGRTTLYRALAISA